MLAFGTILWSPQKLPAGSSELVGRTLESFFRQIRSSEFVGRTLKVSSGKLVGSPGDPCGAREMRHHVHVGAVSGGTECRPTMLMLRDMEANYAAAARGAGAPNGHPS